MKPKVIKVHWNLQKLLWSITQSGQKVKHVRTFTLKNPVPHIGEGKYLEAQTKSKRTVCAWIKGEAVSYHPIAGRPFSYNPHKSHDFYYLDDNSPLENSRHYATFSIADNGLPVSVIN